MSRPRLCEILGVEPNQKFEFGEYKFCYIKENGELCCFHEGEDEYYDSLGRVGDAICLMIEHPEEIVCEPAWTEQEINNAKALKNLYPECDAIYKRSGTTMEVYCRGKYERNKNTLVGNIRAKPHSIDPACFPSLESRNYAYLDDIISYEKRLRKGGFKNDNSKRNH